MLVLTRKVGQSIIVDGDIRVTVLDTNGCFIRLGIEAPKDVPVDREEIHWKKAANK